MQSGTPGALADWAPMAGRERDSGNEPSLELPSFGLRRRKRKDKQQPDAARAETPQQMLGGESSRFDTNASTTQRELPRTSGDSGQAAPGVSAGPGPEPSRPPEPVPAPVPDPEPDVHRPEQPETAQPSGGLALPAVAGRTAAVVTGLVIGLLAVGLTFGSLQLCEAARGTTSCGRGPGFLLLLAVVILLTYLGSWLLRLLGVDDPGSTSFLAVGLLAVIAMLFLISVLASWWMVIVIPLVSAGTYALSHWVTTTLVEEE